MGGLGKPCSHFGSLQAALPYSPPLPSSLLLKPLPTPHASGQHLLTVVSVWHPGGYQACPGVGWGERGHAGPGLKQVSVVALMTRKDPQNKVKLK